LGVEPRDDGDACQDPEEKRACPPSQ
jgi:hypothetical protein